MKPDLFDPMGLAGRPARRAPMLQVPHFLIVFFRFL